MQPGWNLGNSLDATGADETSWGNPRITAALLDNVRAQAPSVRAPYAAGALVAPVLLSAAPARITERILPSVDNNGGKLQIAAGSGLT